MDEEKLRLEKELLRKQMEREEAIMAIIRDIPLIAASLLQGQHTPPPVTFARAVPRSLFGEATRQLDEEAKKDTEEILEAMKPDIEENGTELLEGVLRETVTMLDGGTKKKIKKEMKAGRKPKLRRKKGCLYLVIGDGVSEPIEEIYLRM